MSEELALEVDLLQNANKGLEALVAHQRERIKVLQADLVRSQNEVERLQDIINIIFSAFPECRGALARALHKNGGE